MLDTIDKILELQVQRDQLFLEYFKLKKSKNEFDYSLKRYVLDEIILVHDDLKEIEADMCYEEKNQREVYVSKSDLQWYF